MTDSKKTPRSSRPKSFREYSGKVVLEPVYQGSKSERLAVKLDTGEEKLLLRRAGIRSYRDKTLEDLVGKKITCHGLKRQDRLYLKDFESE